MNGVIYARYSSDNQREESIEGQLRECKAYAEKNGITIIENYIDRAHTATNDNRPDFQRMIKDSTKGKFEIVLVWKLDRFARNRYDSAHYKNQLKKNGIKVVSATENIADGPDGILLESVLEGMAEYYSAELSVKVKRGLTENALKCKFNGGTMTFGYKLGPEQSYEIDPVNAPIVLDIFKQYDCGKTIKEISQYYSEKGLSLKPDINFITRTLHNRKYIGEYRYNETIVPDGIPAIVPKDLFNRVQEQLAKNKKAPAAKRGDDGYILTTKLFCGCCKTYMVGECGTSASKGKTYNYYRCVNSKKKKTCKSKHKSIRKDRIEELVISEIKKAVFDDAFVDEFAKRAYLAQEEESSELAVLRKELAETEKGIKNMVDAIQAGIVTESTKQRLTDLEATKSNLEISIAKEEIKAPIFSEDEIRFFIMSFRKVDYDSSEGRRLVVDRFLNSVVNYDDYILINMNFNNSTKQVDIKELDAPAKRSSLKSLSPPEKSTCIHKCSFQLSVPFGTISTLRA